ncbi:MAG: acyltransferase [Lachnospiraceae bacterium]|nr:acyltransferase [Candidatus Colinaster equi]
MISSDTSKIMRTIAIILVLISHFAGWMYVDATWLILKTQLSYIGPVGVDIFFAMSGYGLVKSAAKNAQVTGKNGITWQFVFKRILTVYCPYILVVGIIYLLDGTFAEADGWTIIHYLTGRDYWFMCVLFMMYIAFMLIWRIGKCRHLLITLFVAGLSAYLYHLRMKDFWQLSNASFLLGIYAASIESKCSLVVKKVTHVITLAIGLIGTAFTSIMIYLIRKDNPVGGFEVRMVLNVFVTITFLALAYLMKNAKSGKFGLLGKNTLFVYLLNAPIFWPLMMKLENIGYVAASCITAAVTVAAGVLIGELYSYVTDKIYEKCMKR